MKEESDRVELKLDSAHTVTAGHAVIATNSPIHDLVALHTKQAPYRTYAIGFEIEAGTIDDALYWDTEEPYHYVRLTSTASEPPPAPNGNKIEVVTHHGK